MKIAIMVLGGISLAFAGFMVWGPRRQKPVAELAHSLEVAWADHHTVV